MTDGIISCNIVIVVTLKRVRDFESSSECVNTKIITMTTVVSGQLFPYYPLSSLSSPVLFLLRSSLCSSLLSLAGPDVVIV